jgi:GntR family transcriptional repressor for pyruvate dehydrogenase complex
VSREAPDPSAAAAPRRSASEEVADGIRQFIAEHRHEPGDRVGREEDLVGRFGVSRPTVREAVRLLASSHLVRVSKGPGGGIFVAATPEEGIGRTLTASIADLLTNDSIQLPELLETRMLFAAPMAAVAARRADAHDVQRLRALIAEEQERPDDVEIVLAVDRQLHGAISTIAGYRLAAALTEWVADVLQPSLHEQVAATVVPQILAAHHGEIVAAIEQGDAARAEEAMREHVLYLLDVSQVELQDHATPAG